MNKKANLYGITLENYTPQEIAQLKQLLDSQYEQSEKSNCKVTYVTYIPSSGSGSFKEFDATKINSYIKTGYDSIY